MKTVKSLIGEGQPTTVTTYDLLHTILDFYIGQNDKDMRTDRERVTCTEAPVPEYQKISEKSTENEELYVGAVSSITTLVKQLQHHQSTCHSVLTVHRTKKIHHVLQVKVGCDDGHILRWMSSPHGEGGKFLVNLRIAHGYITSGILPNQMEILCESSKL